MELRNRNIEERLLDRQKIDDERAFWQWFNLLSPLALLAIIGAVIYETRRRKYT